MCDFATDGFSVDFCLLKGVWNKGKNKKHMQDTYVKKGQQGGP